MKPLVVGLNNPLSRHPDDALVPYPPGCAGWRLWQLMREVRPSTTMEEYANAFDRRNLWRGKRLPEGRGSAAAYRAEGQIVRDACDRREDVVLLGVRVWDAVTDLAPPSWFGHKDVGSVRYWFLPHPSGRNVLYNSAKFRRRAGELLVRLAGLEVAA